jgi:Spy/CpxP family protein refolding chaperone
MTSIFRTRRAVAVLARAAALTAAVVALTAVGSSQASAQGGGGGQGRGGAAQQAMMFEGITLTEAQTARVDSIRASFRQKMMAMPRPAQGEQPDSSAMAARRTMTEEQRAAIRGVLTADQAKTFDANVEKMRNAPRGRPNGGQ